MSENKFCGFRGTGIDPSANRMSEMGTIEINKVSRIKRSAIKTFVDTLKAEFVKLKGSSIIFAHILIPIITSGIFLLYYSFSPWDENSKLIVFYQALGTGLPLLIGVFTAGLMEQEQNAGNYHNMLTIPQKLTAFLSKLVILLVLGLLALLFTSLIFGMRGRMWLCIRASLVIWLSSLPIYIWQMILAFRFGKGVSIAGGIISGLVSALFITNMGVFVWKYVFISWTGRVVQTYLKMTLGDSGADTAPGNIGLLYTIFMIFSISCYLLWSYHWEGSKVTE